MERLLFLLGEINRLSLAYRAAKVKSPEGEIRIELQQVRGGLIFKFAGIGVADLSCADFKDPVPTVRPPCGGA